MPWMNGFELLPKAKALRPDVPIIMITAYGDPETKRKALENGAEALLTKPIDFESYVMRSTCGLNVPHNLPDLLQRMSPVLMLWTAPPPARECHGCGCC